MGFATQTPDETIFRDNILTPILGEAGKLHAPRMRRLWYGVANFATLTEEIEVVQGSKDLDKDVAEATEQRNEENEDFTETMAADTAAEEPFSPRCY